MSKRRIKATDIGPQARVQSAGRDKPPTWATPDHEATEAEVMREIEAALAFLGCVTPGHHVRMLMADDWGHEPVPEGYYIRTNQRRGNMAGTDAGCPDILVAPIASLPLWLPFEVKRRQRGKRGGWLRQEQSAEQTALAGAGAIWIVQDAGPVLARVKAFRRMFTGSVGDTVRKTFDTQ
jgi:hypothetical protein